MDVTLWKFRSKSKNSAKIWQRSQAIKEFHHKRYKQANSKFSSDPENFMNSKA